MRTRRSTRNGRHTRVFWRRALAGGAGALGLGAAAHAAGVHRAMRDVRAELRTPALYLPMTINNRLALRIGRRVLGRPSPSVPGVRLEQRNIEPYGGRPEVGVHVYEPPVRRRPSGALLWIHSGGLISGRPQQDHDLCGRFADELGILVVSVDYRLAPENPFPAGLHDCHTALTWLHRNADALGVDPARIAIGGASAGGGLAAVLAQRAHDDGGLPVAFQLLVYPMLDDRTVLRTDHEGRGRFGWTPASNRFAWSAYLGGRPRADDAPGYAVAARRGDLSGLPPAWIGVGDLDLFYPEDVEYAERLRSVGVDCELHVEPGMYHGADVILPQTVEAMRAFRTRMADALRPALSPPPRRERT
jgi:acetyl esterase/lipase